MSYLICVAGREGQGKEDFIQELCGELSALGLSIGVISPGGSGSAQAASGQAVQAEIRMGPEGLSFHRQGGRGQSLAELAGTYMNHLDLVLSLVNIQEKRPKIEFLPQGGAPSLANDPGLKAVVGPDVPEGAYKSFTPDQLAELAQFIAGEVVPVTHPPKVRVVLDGKKVPIKGFVQDFLAGGIRGMVETLRGGDRSGRMVIYLEE